MVVFHFQCYFESSLDSLYCVYIIISCFTNQSLNYQHVFWIMGNAFLLLPGGNFKTHYKQTSFFFFCSLTLASHPWPNVVTNMTAATTPAAARSTTAMSSSRTVWRPSAGMCKELWDWPKVSKVRGGANWHFWFLDFVHSSLALLVDLKMLQTCCTREGVCDDYCKLFSSSCRHSVCGRAHI